MSYLFLISVIVLFMAGCTKEEVPDGASFQNVSKDGWPYGSTLKFAASADTLADAGKFAVSVRYSGAYKYANLWLEIIVPTKDSTYVDTINVKLADKYGRPLGRGAGVSFIKIDTLPRTYLNVDSGEVSVRHVMRVDTLYDVEQVGLLRIR